MKVWNVMIQGSKFIFAISNSYTLGIQLVCPANINQQYYQNNNDTPRNLSCSFVLISI